MVCLMQHNTYEKSSQCSSYVPAEFSNQTINETIPFHLILEPNKKLERFRSGYQTRNGTIPFQESGMERFRPTRFSNQTHPKLAQSPTSK
jgi:hypothetical protein